MPGLAWSRTGFHQISFRADKNDEIGVGDLGKVSRAEGQGQDRGRGGKKAEDMTRGDSSCSSANSHLTRHPIGEIAHDLRLAPAVQAHINTLRSQRPGKLGNPFPVILIIPRIRNKYHRIAGSGDPCGTE